MTDPSQPAYGMLAFAVVAMLVVALLIVSVKLRAASARARGVSVYDFGADLKLPPALHSRGYQFALYLTIKSFAREPAESPPVRSPAVSR